ncbi:MAG: HD-GYP domain-containing protein [Solirubrobacteraceae bacterium]
MSLEPTLEDHDTLAETFRRHRSRMTTRELASAALSGGGFVAAVGALLVLAPPDAFAVVPPVLCVLVLALATRVHFDTPAGVAVPTQLAFIPLLFVTPGSVMPLAVVLAWLLGRLPEVLRREVPPSRLLQLPGNSWYSLGPVAVFAVAGVAPSRAGVGLLVAALAAQFLIDFVVGAVRDAIARGITISEELSYVWVYGVDVALSIVGVVFARELHATPALVLGLIPLLGVLAMFGRERHQRLDGLLELNRAYRGTALALGDVVESEDGYTGEHCKSVLELSLAVGAHVGLDAEQFRNLEFAALLHDVGKIVIPKEILNKPGKLEPDEWTIMKSHTVEGQRVLARVGGFMDAIGRLVRSHHERWDGRGYPDGLAGEEIPIEARIIACCDSWNAMRTDRPYRKALSHEVAVAEMAANASSQFDPQVVEVLLRVVDPQQPQAASQPSPGEQLRRHTELGLLAFDVDPL